MAVTKSIGINGKTRIAGVIGHPIEHTLSPAMQNAAFAATGIDAVYLPLGVEPHGLGRLIQALADINALGLNVTIPYKQRVLAFLDECAPEAERIGAVNTIVFRDGKKIGYNTDGQGFLDSLKGALKPKGRRVVLLGAGGAGRAVAVSLAGAGAMGVAIVEPNASQRNKLVAHLRDLGFSRASGFLPQSSELQAQLAQAQLVVNATPLGLKAGDPLPLPEEWIPKECCVMDLAYGHGLTPFLQAARKRGCRVIPGWNMLLHQGAAAFKLWTGVKAPVEDMRRALVRAGV